MPFRGVAASQASVLGLAGVRACLHSGMLGGWLGLAGAGGWNAGVRRVPNFRRGSGEDKPQTFFA